MGYLPKMAKEIGRRGFIKKAAAWGIGAAGTLTGCGRVGFEPPAHAEIPLPEAQGLLSRAPESLHRPHGKEEAWFNPWWPSPNSFGAFLRWKFYYRNPYIPEKSRTPEVARVVNDGAYLSRPERTASITWAGHCTFVVKDGADTFVTDPHFGQRALIYPRVQPPGLPVEKIPEDAFCVLSHNHYDHMNEWTVKALPESVQWFVPKGLGGWFRERGRRAKEMDWWQSTQRGRWKITCLPMQHWSNRIWMSRNGSLWCGWLVESDERKYFFGGDSGYFHGFKEYGKKFGPIDVAMLPIGAYEPRWFMRYAHMNPEEAYRAFRELGAKWMFPMHWGTFDLTDEPVDRPPVELRREVARLGGNMDKIRLMAVGERWSLG